MQRLLAVLLLSIIGVTCAFAQVTTGPGGRPFPRRMTISQLPALGSQELLIITDGADAQDCTVGGGSARVLCAYNPDTSGWETIGDGNQAGAGGAPTTAQYIVASTDATLSQELILGTAVIMRGSHAGIPAFGVPGRLYLYTDEPYGMVRDTGVAWEEWRLDWSKVTGKSIINAEIAAAAGIVESKLALNFPTHSNANDPTTAEKAGLAANSPSLANPVITQTQLGAHTGASTNVHGILDTSTLVLTTDSRLSDDRPPVDGSVTSLKIATGAILEEDLNAALLGPAGSVFGLRKLGTSSTDAAAGDDARLSDERLPSANSVTSGKIVNGAILEEDLNATILGPADNVFGLRKLGTAMGEALPGDHVSVTNERTPANDSVTTGKLAAGAVEASDLNAALLGPADNVFGLRKLGTAAGEALPGTHSSVTDARTPTAHAISHYPAGTDDLSSIYATRAYADAIASGLQPKVRVHLATTTTLPANTYANGTAGVGATLTRSTNGTVETIDGDALALNEYLLVKDEAAGLKNGIYELTTVGDGSTPYVLTRRTDLDTDAEVNPGVSTYVERGTAVTGNLGKTFFIITADPITVGTTAIAWDIFQSTPGAGGTGAGLTPAGDVGAGTCITVGADTVGVSGGCLTTTQLSGTAAITKAQISDIETWGPAELPLPTLSDRGAVIAKVCTPPDTVTAINTDGTVTCTPPAVAGAARVVRVATGTNVSLTTPGAVIDGVTLNSGDAEPLRRILLVRQTTASQNGLYLWTDATTTLVRTTDTDIAAEFTPGFEVTALEGMTGKGAWFFTNTALPTLGTTALTFQRATTLPFEVVTPSGDTTGVTDTLTLQNAISRAGALHKGRVIASGGEFFISQISLPQGVSLSCGDVSGGGFGSTLTQVDGVNVSAIVTSVANPDYWHNATIENCRISKVSGATDTLGSGILVGARTGENLNFRNLHIERFPESGIRFTHGGAPLYVHNIHVFGNDAYGIDVDRDTGDTWQTIHLQGISGDNNGTALIRVKGMATGNENILLSDIKAESGQVGRQLNVIELQSTPAFIMIQNLSAIATGGQTGNAVVLNQSGFTPRIQFVNVRTDGDYTYLVQDLHNGHNILDITDTGDAPFALYYHAQSDRHTFIAQSGIYIAGTALNPKIWLRTFGTIEMGDGTNPTDVVLQRGAANLLETASGDDFRAGGRLASTPQSVTCADDGTGAAGSLTVTPSASLVLLTNSDPHGCTVTMSETGALNGALSTITVIANAGGTVNIADSAGVSDLQSAFAGGLGASLSLMYVNSAWYEVTRSTGQAASQVAFTPTGTLGSTTVQDAIAEVVTDLGATGAVSKAQVSDIGTWNEDEIPNLPAEIIATGTLDPNVLPLPTSTTPGGVIAMVCPDPNHVSAINTDGTVTCTAPSLSTGSAAIAIANLPASDTEGTTYLINDGVTGDDCTVGFGAHHVWCTYDSALEFWYAVAAPSLQRACETGGGTCGFTSLTEALPFVEAPSGLDGPRCETFGRSGDFVRECMFGAQGSEEPLDPEPIFVHRNRLWEILYETGSPNSFEVLGSIENIDGTVFYDGILKPGGELSTCSAVGTAIATFDGTTWSCQDPSSLGIQQSSLQVGYDIGTGVISGVTAAKPISIRGTDVDGAGFDLYESGGDAFFECKLTDGTPCHHAFELSTNRQFSIGTSVRPDAWVIRHAEPETVDTECRTTDPTIPTSNRLKVYCKNDAPYVRNDAGTVTALGTGDVLGDDTSTTAQNIVAYTSTGGKNITELTGTQGDVLYHNGTNWAKLAAGTSGHFLKTNGAGANPAWAAAAGGGPTAPIRPYSAIPVTAGMVYPIIIDGDEMLGVTTATLLTSDAIWRLGFDMPPTLATGCTYKLQLDMKANATSGVMRINPKWNTWAPGVTRTSLTLNAETVTPDSVTGAAGSGDTVTLGAADSNQLIRIKWTLNASTVTAAQRIAMDLVFEDTSTTLAVESGYLASVICE